MTAITVHYRAKPSEQRQFPALPANRARVRLPVATATRLGIRCPRRGGPCQGRLAHSAIRQDEILPWRVTHRNAGGGNEGR